jgi:hypothetical protein
VRALALDPATGDLLVSRGRLEVVTGPAALRQRLQMRLRLWQGEWFADTSVGVPWLLFLGVKGAQALAESTLRRAITTCPGVASLDAFTFNVDSRTRRATLSFRVTATTGDVLDFADFVAGDDATTAGARVAA